MELLELLSMDFCEDYSGYQIHTLYNYSTFSLCIIFFCSDLDKEQMLKTLLQPDDDRIEFKMFNSIIKTYLESKQAMRS